MSKNASTAATEWSQYMHFSSCHPSASEKVPLKERHCAFYEQTQLKKDSSRTNDISNSAYSNAAAHKNMLTKHKPRSNSHNETTLWNSIQSHSKTSYHSSPPIQPRSTETQRDPYQKLVFDHQQREPCANFSKCSHCRLQQGKITQRSFGQS